MGLLNYSNLIERKEIIQLPLRDNELYKLNVKKRYSGKYKTKKKSSTLVQCSMTHNVSEGKSNSISTQKEQIQDVDSVLYYNQSTVELANNLIDKVKVDVKDDDIHVLGTTGLDIDSHKNTKIEATKQGKKCKVLLCLKKFNILITLLFSLMLIIIGVLQYKTYNRQADIAANSNKLAQYQYRFDFYQKLEDLQKEASVIKKDPHLEIDQLNKLSYEILSLIRRSSLLFDKDVSNNINSVLAEHLNLITDLNNNDINDDYYKNEMMQIITKYGNFLNSDDFKEYIDINRIK